MRLVEPGSSRLRRFQQRFARALEGELPPGDCGAEVARLAAQPGFAVYRNTVFKGCIDALQANFPAVARLVGEQWFRAAAAVYACNHLPASPMLLDYGADFARFLEGFEPAADLPYLAGVARLDRFWTEAHGARDEVPVPAHPVAALAPERLAQAVLRPHASARWAWFDDQPIFTLWSRSRDQGGETQDLGDVAWTGQGALLVRPLDAVGAHELGRAGCVFLDACDRGEPLGAAAMAAQEADPAVDLAALMAQLLQAGAFGRLELNDEPLEEELP
jgi:hypothetical protein